MRQLPHMGIVLGMHAHTFPDKIGARDLERAMTFRTWHERSCRLANALMGLGLSKGDRVCVLAYNCVEWLEIYAATALAGLVAVPINNFELGQHGRHRTNVWDYAGVNTMRAGRLEELAMHPTVKPVALVADAIKDCSRRGGLVLDPFCGSGTILIAAERTGRKARALEIDPAYVDVAVRRWQAYTGKSAVLAGSGETFETIEEQRIAKSAAA